jgi:hypothetical protein
MLNGKWYPEDGHDQRRQGTPGREISSQLIKRAQHLPRPVFCALLFLPITHHPSPITHH